MSRSDRPSKLQPILLMSMLALLGVLAFFLVQTGWIEPWLPTSKSSLVREVVARVGDDGRVTAALGRPVRAGWSTVGNETRDETGWTEAFMWIPVSGPKGAGTLYVRAGRSSGAWTFSSLQLRFANQSSLAPQRTAARSRPRRRSAYRVCETRGGTTRRR